MAFQMTFIILSAIFLSPIFLSRVEAGELRDHLALSQSGVAVRPCGPRILPPHSPKRGHDWTSPFRFMGSKREPLVRGICPKGETSEGKRSARTHGSALNGKDVSKVQARRAPPLRPRDRLRSERERTARRLGAQQ